MKSSILLLIIPAVFILNVDYSFAEENTSAQVGVPVQANAVAEPVAEPVTNPPSAQGETSAPVETVPVLTVPVEVVPVTENKEEGVTDSHLVIEPAPVPVNQNIQVADHNSFNRMKQLAGRWEGAGNNGSGEKQDKIIVTYEVTAGGSAVLEKIFPGTSQEMITIYYEEKGKLTLMHFSMIGTRSVMTLKPVPSDMKAGEVSDFNFMLSDGNSLDPEVDTHMHSLKIAFIDLDHIAQEWIMFEAGKPSGTYSFDLTRPPPSH